MTNAQKRIVQDLSVRIVWSGALRIYIFQEVIVPPTAGIQTSFGNLDLFSLVFFFGFYNLTLWGSWSILFDVVDEILRYKKYPHMNLISRLEEM